MKDINDYIGNLYKDSAVISDLVGILYELLERIEILEDKLKDQHHD